MDNHNRLADFFWVDMTSRRAYECFGDVVVFDTTFVADYNLVFAQFFGVSHHRQTVFFSCGFLKDEQVEIFLWLFETWMKAMSNNHSKMIITNQDLAMHAAISQFYSNTFHRLCIWHIMKKVPNKVGPIVAMSNEFQAFQDCVWNSTNTRRI